MDIGRRVKTARKRAQLSQDALARRAGISVSAVAQIEQGERTDPHYSTLSKLADGLGMSVGVLLEEAALLGKDEASPRPGAFDTPEKTLAREAIGALMKESGAPVRYLAMPQADLSALFDTMQTFEEAKALADAVGSERELLRELHPNAAFPGHGTWAIIGTLATAATGLRSVAKREAARIQAEAEEAARPLEMAAGVL